MARRATHCADTAVLALMCPSCVLLAHVTCEGRHSQQSRFYVSRVPSKPLRVGPNQPHPQPYPPPYPQLYPTKNPYPQPYARPFARPYPQPYPQLYPQPYPTKNPNVTTEDVQHECCLDPHFEPPLDPFGPPPLGSACGGLLYLPIKQQQVE